MCNQKITFATNTNGNTLEYTKLLLQSLKENLDCSEHEIIVFIDSDYDGTLDYLLSIKHDYYDLKIITHSVKPIVGCQRNQNLIVELAKHDIVSYLQNDMVVSKHYDTNVLKHLEHDMILSSTRIEPPLHGLSDVVFTKNLGLDADTFKLSEFLVYAESVKKDLVVDYFFAPYTFYKQTWYKLGGYDTIFRRSRCDSDLVQRSLRAGIKVKQTFAANVYHFTCTSSRGKNWFDKSNQQAQLRVKKQEQADGIEIRRFIRKWGNFNHGEALLKKYDIDLVVLGDQKDLMDFCYSVEPFFSRIWLNSELTKDQILQRYESEQVLANELFNVTTEEWNESKHLCNQTNYDEIFCVGRPKFYNILIELDVSKNNNTFFDNIGSLAHIFDANGVGSYTLDDTYMDVQRLVDVSPQCTVTNPNFDMKLVNIY